LTLPSSLGGGPGTTCRTGLDYSRPTLAKSYACDISRSAAATVLDPSPSGYWVNCTAPRAGDFGGGACQVPKKRERRETEGGGGPLLILFLSNLIIPHFLSLSFFFFFSSSPSA
jgi:hypothetical protein